jgi:hypothetical protein
MVTAEMGAVGRADGIASVQSDDIPVHLRRLVALRDQHCRYVGEYFLYARTSRMG